MPSIARHPRFGCLVFIICMATACQGQKKKQSQDLPPPAKEVSTKPTSPVFTGEAGDFVNIGPIFSNAAVSEIGMFNDKKGESNLLVLYRASKEIPAQIAHFNLEDGTGKLLEASAGKMHDPVYHEELNKVYILSSQPANLVEYDLSSGQIKSIQSSNTRVQKRTESLKSIRTNSFYPDKNIQSISMGDDGKLYMGSGTQGHVMVYDPYQEEISYFGIADDPGKSLLLSSLNLDEENRTLEVEILNPTGKSLSLGSYQLTLKSSNASKGKTSSLGTSQLTNGQTQQFDLSYSGDISDYTLSLEQKQGNKILDQVHIQTLIDQSSKGGRKRPKTFNRFPSTIGGIDEDLETAKLREVYKYEWLNTRGARNRNNSRNRNQGQKKFKYYRYVYSIGGDAQHIYGVIRNQAFWYLLIIDQKSGQQKIVWKFNTDPCTIRKNLDSKGKTHWIVRKGNQYFRVKGFQLTALSKSELGKYQQQENNSNIITKQERIGEYFPYDLDFSQLTPQQGQINLNYRDKNSSRWKNIRLLNAKSSSVRLKALFPFDDNYLMGFFDEYHPLIKTDLQQHSPIGGALMSYYDYLVYDPQTLYFSGYPKAFVKYDMTQPWDVETKRATPTSNPKQLKVLNAKHMTDLAKSQNGMVYVIGRHNREGKNGSELGWLHPKTQRKGKFQTNDEIDLLNYGTQDMMTGVSQGSEWLVLLLKSQYEKEEKLVLFDIGKHQGERLEPSFIYTLPSNHQDTKKILRIDQEGIVVAATRNFFVFDIPSRKVKKSYNLPNGLTMTMAAIPEGGQQANAMAYLFAEKGAESTYIYGFSGSSFELLSDDLGPRKTRRMTYWKDQLILYEGRSSITPLKLPDGSENKEAYNVEIFKLKSD